MRIRTADIGAATRPTEPTMRLITLAASAALATTVLAAAAPAAATVTYGSTAFISEVHAFGRDSQSGLVVANNLPATPITFNGSQTFGVTSTVTSRGSASFTDATSGVFSITDLYLKAHYVNLYEPAGAYGKLNLSYTFTVDSSYLARLTYDLDFGDDVDPALMVLYRVYKDDDYNTPTAIAAGQGVLFTDPFGPGTYTLQISASGSIQAGPTSIDQLSRVQGSVAFDLLPNGRLPPATSPTPEPQSWALMIAGFGLAGGVLRRRSFAAS